MGSHHPAPPVLISEADIRNRVTQLGTLLNQEYAGKEITAVCILKGSFIFFSDVIRQLDTPVTCEFLGLAPYSKKTPSSGEVKITLDVTEPLENRHVLVFDDVVDTGLTLTYIMSTLRARKPASIRSCALLVKGGGRASSVEVHYVGFRIGEHYVAGYGIDDQGLYRNLPYVAQLPPGDPDTAGPSTPNDSSGLPVGQA